MATDVNADGRLDLVAGLEDSCCGAYALMTFPGSSQGLAEPPLVTPVAYRPELLIPGDFDRDCRSDVFVGPCGMGYYGAGDGTYQPKYYTLCTDWVEVAPLGDYPSVVARAAGDPQVLETGGSNGYYFGRDFTKVRLPEPIDGVTATDWDDDGHVDYVVVSESRSLLRIVLADPNRSMNGLLGLHFCLGLALLPGDLDGDGHADVVDIERTGNCGRNYLDIHAFAFHCDEQGLLRQGPGYGSGAIWQASTARGVLADLAEDGALDLLVAAGGTVFRLDNFGRGSSAARTAGLSGRHRADRPGGFQRGRPAGPGDARGIAPTSPIYRQVMGGAFRGDAPLAAGPGLRGLLTGDCNDDGLVDLVLTDYLTNQVTIYAGQPDGSLVELASASAGVQPVAAALTDFDLDGVPEIAVAAQGSAEVVLLRLLEGTPAGSRRIADGRRTRRSASMTGDVTGDGHPDLLVAHETAPVTLRVWQAGDMFSPPVSIPGSQGSDARLGDLDRDGRADLLLGRGVAYLNLGGGPTATSPDLLGARVTAEAVGRRIEWNVRGYATGDRFRLFRVNEVGAATLVVPRYFSGATHYAVVDSAAEAAGSRYQLEMFSSEGVMARLELPVPVGVAPLVSLLTAMRTGEGVSLQWLLAQTDPDVRLEVYREGPARPVNCWGRPCPAPYASLSTPLPPPRPPPTGCATTLRRDA